MVSGPELARLCMEYKDLDETKNETLEHHEDSNSFQKQFSKHVKDLVAVFSKKGPFSTVDLTTIGTERKEMAMTSVENVAKASKVGLKVNIKAQFN